MRDRCEFIDDALEDSMQCMHEADVTVQAVNIEQHDRLPDVQRVGDARRSCLQHLGMMLSDNEEHVVTRIERKNIARTA